MTTKLKTFAQLSAELYDPISNETFRKTLRSVVPSLNDIVALYDAWTGSEQDRTTKNIYTVKARINTVVDHVASQEGMLDLSEQNDLVEGDEARYNLKKEILAEEALNAAKFILWKESVEAEAHQQHMFRERLEAILLAARVASLPAEQLQTMREALSSLSPFKTQGIMSPTSIVEFDTVYAEVSKLSLEAKSTAVVVPLTRPKESEQQRQEREARESAQASELEVQEVEKTATSEKMVRELNDRRIEKLEIGEDLFFRTVMLPYLYWIFGVHMYLFNRREISLEYQVAMKRILEQLYATSGFPESKTSVPPQRPSPETLMKEMMERLKITNDMMIKPAFAGMDQFTLPRGAVFLRDLHTHFKNFETQYFFGLPRDRLVMYGKTFERAEFDDTQHKNFFNYFRHFWVPKGGGAWVHDLNDRQRTHRFKEYSSGAVSRSSPLWMRLFDHTTNAELHGNLMNFLFESRDDTIFVPFFHCLVTEKWTVEGLLPGDGNLFWRLGQHLMDTYVNEFKIKTIEEIVNMRVLFSTHMFMVSQIVLFWMMGIKYVRLELPNVEALSDIADAYVKIRNEEEFFYTLREGSTAVDKRFGTLRNDILPASPERLPNKFGVRKLLDSIQSNIPLFNPASAELRYFTDHPNDLSLRTALLDQQNTVYFTATVGELLALPHVLTAEQYPHFIEATMLHEAEAELTASAVESSSSLLVAVEEDLAVPGIDGDNIVNISVDDGEIF